MINILVYYLNQLLFAVCDEYDEWKTWRNAHHVAQRWWRCGNRLICEMRYATNWMICYLFGTVDALATLFLLSLLLLLLNSFLICLCAAFCGDVRLAIFKCCQNEKRWLKLPASHTNTHTVTHKQTHTHNVVTYTELRGSLRAFPRR